MDWEKILYELLTKHKGKTLGVLLGLIFGLLAAIFSFLKAVFISICIAGGYFVGRRIDENVNFRDVMDRMFKDY